MGQAAIDLRAWWWSRQGLDGSLSQASPAEILKTAGWARSVAGAGPYLTLFSRGGYRRAQVDQAVADLQIHELPSARGCTHILPAADFALGLRIAQEFGDGDRNTARKLGVTDKEVDKLCQAVLKALATGPMDPDEIKKSVGEAARSLGPEGVKKGMTTTLPLVLGQLQNEGEIRRVPVNGRLDQQRYKYSLWSPNPLAAFHLPLEECYTELARRYFRWIGPASLAEFQWFSGLGVGTSKKAIAPLGLIPLSDSDDRLLFPADRDALLSFRPPRQSQYNLVSSLDSIVLLRRNLSDLTDAKDLAHSLLQGSKGVGSSLKDLPSHAIFDRGRLIGLWEFDVDSSTIVWMSFVRPNKDLTQVIARTEAYISEDLGDARSFSLDSPRSRVPRLEALRAAVG